jgi:hypothetical protein
MDAQIAKRLIDETELLLENDATEWAAGEALWRPYVDQADVDAQFHLAEFYLDHDDEGPEKEKEKETEMKKLLRLAADRGWQRTRSRVFWQVTRSAATLRTQPIFSARTDKTGRRKRRILSAWALDPDKTLAQSATRPQQ